MPLRCEHPGLKANFTTAFIIIISHPTYSVRRHLVVFTNRRRPIRLVRFGLVIAVLLMCTYSGGCSCPYSGGNPYVGYDIHGGLFCRIHYCTVEYFTIKQQPGCNISQVLTISIVSHSSQQPSASSSEPP